MPKPLKQAALGAGVSAIALAVVAFVQYITGMRPDECDPNSSF